MMRRSTPKPRWDPSRRRQPFFLLAALCALLALAPGARESAAGGGSPAGSQDPVISGMTPREGARGRTLDVTLFGTRFAPGATADFGEGIHVNSATVFRASLREGVRPLREHILVVNVSIDPEAPLGPHEVTVMNPSGARATAPEPFQVVKGGPALSTFSLTPVPARGGRRLSGMVTLTGPAPAGGARVTFRSSDRRFRPPAPVVVQAGRTRRSFSYATRRVNRNGSYQVTAAYGGVSRTVTVTLTRR